MLGILKTKPYQVRRLLCLTAQLDKLVQFKLSDIGEGIAEVQLKDWHIKVGDKVNEFDEVCEVQSDKAAVTITSRYEDQVAKVGAPLIDIEVDDDGSEVVEDVDEDSASPQKSQKHPEHSDRSRSAKLLMTPAVRRLLKENKIDIRKITGTGKDGRVLKEDVLAFLNVVETKEGHEQRAPTALKAFEPKLTEDKVVPIRGYTRAMISSMSEALKIPHFGYDDEYTADSLVALRGQLKSEAKRRGIKLTYMPIILKATSVALTDYPQLNAQADSEHKNIIYKANHNLCVAMDTPGGLVVPNVKYCEQKNMWEIAEDLNRLLEAGQKQQLQRDDLLHGTFTLSNIGIIGGTYLSPVIFPPQVAIGAIGRIRKVPRYDHNDELKPTNVMNFSWAADHRFVDGATMARFSNRLKELLENPMLLASCLR
ncbi:unnamed protein product [Bursaphelenchus okinawaensis]|uniref:Dihydrolipoamide acetyltransferase component of pyruvate dehydrogenase complex n=1 Tax=Bursaphelenchus okinawaensis TaxID=465554 RepID=A0A811K611_9BILA|nr:unnamed protein product [Bursaphelenchus okinawaensis]CAG9092220.1 unnamed protein product [Bursaphelenchus okinawaensis]